MKTDVPKYNLLLCANCGATYESTIKTRICSCGHVAGIPPLTDGAFEKAAEGDIVEKPAKSKPEENTANRPKEDGGRVF